MKRFFLFLTAFLASWLGVANAVWADGVTESNFWRATPAANYGEGQKDDVAKTLTIKTAAELAKFSSESTNNDFEGWTILLDNDINLGFRTVIGTQYTMYWQPISSGNVAFKGVFDGQGHTISYLRIDAGLISTDGKNDPARLRYNAFGLFGKVAGIVQNVKVDDFSIYLKKTDVSTSGYYVGTIAGKLEGGGVVRNCVVGGGSVTGVQYVGGLVGLASAWDRQAVIVGCVSSAEVKGGSMVGGLVGNLDGNVSMSYCLNTYSGNIEGSGIYRGQLVGSISNAPSEDFESVAKIYFTNDLMALNNYDLKGYGVTCGTTGLALDFGPVKDLFPLSGITCYDQILKYGDEYIAGNGDELTFGLDITDTRYTFINNVRANGELTSKVSPEHYSFTMPAAAAEVTADLLADNSWDQFPAQSFSRIDDNTKTITITTAEEMGLLARSVNDGNDYSGWTIKLGDAGDGEISPAGELNLGGRCWVPIGSREHPFKGYFDGNGKTIRGILIADTRWATDYTGLFGYVSDGTVTRVRLENCMIGGMNYVGGIVGYLYGYEAIVTDCYVGESCNIAASGDYVGGLVGNVINSARVTGNFCAAPVSGVKRVGGLVGQVNDHAWVQDNFYGGEQGYVTGSGTQGNGWKSYVIGNVSTSVAHLARNYSCASRVKTQINDYDHLAYTVTSGNDDISLTVDEPIVNTDPIPFDVHNTYENSGIKVYGLVDYADCCYMTVNDVVYVEKGSILNFTLSTTAVHNPEFKNVTASSGTLTEFANGKYKLELTAEDQTDVVISASIGGVFWTDYAASKFSNHSQETGTNKHFVIITTPEELALLAHNVNTGLDYTGWTFTLGADIDLDHPAGYDNVKPHWVPIGKNIYPFKGVFNGAGHTISHLTIGDDEVEDYAGLFGFVSGPNGDKCVVKDVKLVSSTITGGGYVGAIAGFVSTNAKVVGCMVGDGVTVSGASYVGGVAGITSAYSNINGCVSYADVTGKEGTDQSYIGGVVGENRGEVRYNVYAGNKVTGKSSVAGVIGRIARRDEAKYNFFINPQYASGNDFDLFAYTVTSATSTGVSSMTVSLKATEENNEEYKQTYTTSGLTFYGTSQTGSSSPAYGSFTYNNQIYVGNKCSAWLDVTVTPEGEDAPNGVWAIKVNGDGDVLKYHGTGYNLTSEDGTAWFEMTADGANCVLTAVSASENFEGQGDDELPYLIRNEHELLQLALAVNKAQSSYKGKYFRLENDLNFANLDESRFQPIGTAEYPFEGYFDGNGKTISGIHKDWHSESGTKYLGVFGYIQYGKVSHLKLSNSTFKGNLNLADEHNVYVEGTSYVGGIVGYIKGYNANDINEATAVYDCMVDNTVDISGYYAGGIVGWVGDNGDNTYKANVEGCVSAAKVYGRERAGGVIGTMYGDALQVRNCLYTRTKPTAEGDYCVATYVEPNAGSNGGYKAYGIGNITGDIANRDIFYTDQTLPKINDYDWMAYEIKAAEGLSLEFQTPSVHYDLTGIQGYVPVGIGYDGHLYTRCADAEPTNFDYTSNNEEFYKTVNFTLKADNGGRLSNVTATADDNSVTYTITDPRNPNLYVTDGVYKLTMGHVGHNFTISATVSIEWAGSGSQSDPYLIDTPEKLNLLAERVNAGTQYIDKFFKVTADITYTAPQSPATSNYTPIGTGVNETSGKAFKGNLDGCGHTISGIVAHVTGNNCAGIFGNINYGSKVKNLTVTNSTFTSERNAGAIAGIMSHTIYGNTSIINCHVGSDVTVSTTHPDYAAGGVLGEAHKGLVEGCTSGATVSNTAQTGRVSAGGIVGKATYKDVTVNNNIYLGNSVTGSTTSAIVGSASMATMENNFYTATSLKGSNTGDFAYQYDANSVTYTAQPTRSYDYNGIAYYADDCLLKYGNTFYSKFQKGDANGDGYINITDYVTIVNKIHNAVSGKFNTFTGDANGDGYINITDAVKVVNTIHSSNQ